MKTTLTKMTFWFRTEIAAKDFIYMNGLKDVKMGPDKTDGTNDWFVEIDRFAR